MLEDRDRLEQNRLYGRTQPMALVHICTDIASDEVEKNLHSSNANFTTQIRSNVNLTIH